MKKNILLTLIALFCAMYAQAAGKFKIGDLYYNLYLSSTGNTATVTSPSSSSEEYRGNIIIPDSVTYGRDVFVVDMIGSAAFDGCTKVTSVTIPNSVTEICSSAFRGCIGLTSITIPKKCSEIAESAFDSCANITSVVWNVESMISWYGTKIFDNINRNIKTFTFGKDVYRIPKGLCNGMSGITSITIPENVYFIEDGTFYGCTSLTSIVWNAKEIYDSGWTCRNQAPFSGIVDSITSFVFGDKVREIPKYLCEGMTKITSIVIPDNVRDIGRNAFGYCRGLTSVTISNNVSYIPQDAFEFCESLTSVNIPNSVTSIGGSAFFACYALSSVTIGNKVTSIGNGAFSSCTSLTSITIPQSCNKYWR